nr:hypothetical protein [Tanacetum cinerariifolium]GEW70126.1 hypothetical protein [Tanacetum cinerariifolium]
MHLPSPDYMPGPEHPPSPTYVPEFVPEPVYPKFMPPKEDVLPAEEQPLPVVASPTADSPGYIPEYDLEEDLEEDNEDPKEDPADYPTDKEDDEEEEESFRDDSDDNEEEEDEDKEEEEEHLASADSVPPPVYRTTTRISSYLSFGIQSYDDPIESRVTIYFYSLPPPPPIALPHTRSSMVMMRAVVSSTYILAPRSETPPSETPPLGTSPLLSIPLPTSSPLLLLPSTDRRLDVPEVTLPPRKRLCIAIGPRFEVEESSSAPTARPTGGFRADYGFGRIQMRLQRRQDTDEIYGRLDDAQEDRLLIYSHLNMLCRDRHSHARTARLIKSEAKLSREDWVQSMDANDTACAEKQIRMRLVIETASRAAFGLAETQQYECLVVQLAPM